MPDTYYTDRRSDLLDDWHIGGRPRLQAIRSKAIELLEAIEAEFQATYEARATKDIADTTKDIAGSACDLLSSLHGRWQRKADNCHLVPDLVSFDDSELSAEHAKWKARSESRRPA